jgi:acyl-CoA thioesterase
VRRSLIVAWYGVVSSWSVASGAVTTRFERDTAIEQLQNGSYGASLNTDWWVQRGPNGGYLAAIILRAIVDAVGDADRAPRSFTVHYAAAPTEGDVAVTTEVVRTGRSLTSCAARMHQDGRLLAVAMAACSSSREGPEFCDLVMPDVTPAAELQPRVLHGEAPPFAHRWDTRWAVGTPPFDAAGTPARSDEAIGGSWMRLEEPQALDAPAIAALADAHIPPVLVRTDERLVVPTVDLTVHFRRALPQTGIAADDFVLAVFRTSAAADGFMEEDGEIWAPDGTLLAQSRQLAVIMRQPG